MVQASKLIKVTWDARCVICERSIKRGRPTLLFSRSEPKLLGIAHSVCSSTKYTVGRFQMCPPQHLSPEDLSFLVYFYPRLDSLPAGNKQNWELRYVLGRLLRDYPNSIAVPSYELKQFLKELQAGLHFSSYIGDLETDFLDCLDKTHALAHESPVAIDIDFRAQEKPEA